MTEAGTFCYCTLAMGEDKEHYKRYIQFVVFLKLVREEISDRGDSLL